MDHRFTKKMNLNLCQLKIAIPVNVSCTPETSSTFLFAYSNDLDSNIVRNALDEIVTKLEYYQSKYEHVANIRFDVKVEENINYHYDIVNFTASVNDKLPDASLGFSNNSAGSDILNVIRKFLTNTQVPVCGSTIFILLKRNPIETDISDIVSQLQNQHVFVRTMVLDNLFGGSDPLIIYNISSETNGLCVFTDQDFVDQNVDFCTNNILNQYLLYATNPIVSGQGQLELPLLHTPSYFSQTLSVFVDITVQNHQLSDSFQTLNLTLTDTRGNHQSLIIDQGQLQYFNGYYNTDIFLKSDTDFEVTLNYNYASTDYESLEIRMSINQAISNWPPYGI